MTWTKETMPGDDWTLRRVRPPIRRITEDGKLRIIERGVIRIIERDASIWSKEYNSGDIWTKE